MTQRPPHCSLITKKEETLTASWFVLRPWCGVCISNVAFLLALNDSPSLRLARPKIYQADSGEYSMRFDQCRQLLSPVTSPSASKDAW